MAKGEGSTLEMLVIGAGPSGLAFAIELAQRWKEAKKEKPTMIDLHITLRDIRIEKSKPNGMFINVGSRTGQMPGRRRDQVVTIQDDVLEHLSPLLKKYMLKNFDECVWPTSRNIPIREIEDQLLELAQAHYFRDTITLEAVTDQNWNQNTNSFQIIIGADGSTSKTRQELFEVRDDDIIQYGEDTALGIAFKVPKYKSYQGLPFEQSVNCALTIAQRRYLLNASEVSDFF
jgi:2-polyprenyl-6-methoxyphenol hydroxylase-like FAD-dependent oxidoreductase